MSHGKHLLTEYLKLKGRLSVVLNQLIKYIPKDSQNSQRYINKLKALMSLSLRMFLILVDPQKYKAKG